MWKLGISVQIGLLLAMSLPMLKTPARVSTDFGAFASLTLTTLLALHFSFLSSFSHAQDVKKGSLRVSHVTYLTTPRQLVEINGFAVHDRSQHSTRFREGDPEIPRPPGEVVHLWFSFLFTTVGPLKCGVQPRSSPLSTCELRLVRYCIYRLENEGVGLGMGG